MAYNIFSGADESAAPAKTPAVPSGGGSYDIFSGSVKAAAPTGGVPAAAPVKPVDTTGFFSSTMKSLGLSSPIGKTAMSTPATMKDIPAPVPKYLRNGPVLQGTVGENMTPEETAKAYDSISKTAENAPGQSIKLPGVDVGIDVPAGNPAQGGMGGPNVVYDQFKSFIEAPEKAARSLTELVGASKPNSDTRKTAYVVPSYAETAGKTVGQLIDEGVPPTAAIILGSGATAGNFANDALMYEGILASGARAVVTKAAVPPESQLVAWDYLGRPKTVAEAEANWRGYQKQYHPDLMGGDATISTQANNAIAIIRKEGIPSTSKVNQAIDAIANRPVKDLFKNTEVPKGTDPKGTIKGFLEDQKTQQARADKLESEIKHYADAHGPDVTRQAIMDNLGFDAATADKLVTQALAARTPAELRAASDAILQEIAPEAAAVVPRTPEPKTPAVKAPKPTPAESAAARVKEDLPGMVDQYIKENKNEVNTDNARELFPEYTKDRSLSADVHESASTVAKAAFNKLLETSKGKGNNTVLFTSGGTGSGKSTGIRSLKNANEFPVIYDGNANDVASVSKKIEAALSHGYNIEMVHVHNDIHNAFENALGRASRQEKETGSGRTVPLQEHMNTHIGSVNTFPKLAAKYAKNPKVTFHVIDNSGTEPKVVENGVDFIKGKRYNTKHESSIRTKLEDQLDKAHKEGRISERTHKGFDDRTQHGSGNEGVSSKPSSSSVKPKTQKEIVAEAVAKEPLSIKEVAKLTKILEPNVRRILGVGTKAGTFKRVADGVYVLKTARGNFAYVEMGDAEQSLARMAEEGQKFNTVILDPAYYSRALIGGNRGLKGGEVKKGGWNEFIHPPEFANMMGSVSQLMKTDDSHVYLMLSGARTAQVDMDKYVKGAVDAGFKAVGEGSYTKLAKSGKAHTNVRGVQAGAERIILLTKSGEVRAGAIPKTLDFRFVRPSIKNGYQTEKPAELMKALIEQSTLEGETVLDPFAGSGVTGEQALKTGRNAVLVEKQESTVNEFTKPRVEAAAASPEANTVPDTATLKPDGYTPEAYKYVKEWGAFEFSNESSAASYAKRLEATDGGTWQAEKVNTGRYRAHRVSDAAPAEQPAHSSLVEQAKKYPTAEDFVKSQTLVYHGSAEPLEAFDENGAFFTDDYMNADGYAGGENVYEGYLDMEKPLVIDAGGRKWDDLENELGSSTREVVANVDSKKYDGVVFNNIKDSWIDDADAQEPGTVYYVFNANKSFLNEEQLTELYEKAHSVEAPAAAETEAPVGINPGEQLPNAPKPVEPVEEGRIPKLTQRIQAKLKETLENAPAYEGMNMDEQSKMAADIIANDYEKAKRIALGLEAPPEGLRVGSMFKAVEDEAVANGDVELQRQLGTAATTKVASAYGQEIKAFDGRDPFSPVQAITDVSKAREKAFEGRIKNTTIKKAKTAEIAKIKTEIKKAAPTKETWDSFIDSITC